MIQQWIMTEAEWWQFWLPQSGVVGGVILACVLLLSIYIIYRLDKRFDK